MFWYSSALVVLQLLLAHGFRQPLHSQRWTKRKFTALADEVSGAPSRVDGKEFEEVLKAAGPLWSQKMTPDEEALIGKLRQDQEEREEEIYRKYPFEDSFLPVLPDCNNYFSGKFGEYFWHQNADQVYVYIPINDSISKRDVDVKFDAKRVEVKVCGNLAIQFECLERIIPDGSFWVIEQDKNGKRYVQLDMEKRFRMINWKGLFGRVDESIERDLEERDSRSKMLEKLFAANKGMSRLTGASPETLNDMMGDEDLLRSITSPDLSGKAVVEDGFDGIEVISPDDFDNIGDNYADDDDDSKVPGVVDVDEVRETGTE